MLVSLKDLYSFETISVELGEASKIAHEAIIEENAFYQLYEYLYNQAKTMKQIGRLNFKD